MEEHGNYWLFTYPSQWGNSPLKFCTTFFICAPINYCSLIEDLLKLYLIGSLMPGFLSMKNIVSKECMMKYKIKFSIWISQNKVKTWIILELKLLFNSLEDLERNVQSSWSNQMIKTTEEKEDIWMINFDFISALTILIVEKYI